jgi:phosphohistidine phosphatase
MELYILRHGIAEESSASGRDEDRQLTAEGRRKLREVLRTAARAGLQPSLILSSPYARAMQTAQAAADLLGYEGEILKAAALVPEARSDDVWQEIRTHREERQVLLASHNPLCAGLAAYLLGSPQLYVDFKKGAILRVDLDQFGSAPRGVLRWMLVPKLAG